MSHIPVWVDWPGTIFDGASFLAVVIDEIIDKFNLGASVGDDFRVGLPGVRAWLVEGQDRLTNNNKIIII